MALVKCPECGKEYSDRAKKCPQCGYVIEKKKTCIECGAILDENMAECPNCGCPVDEQSDNESLIKSPDKGRKKVNKSLVIVGALIGIAIVVLLVLFVIIPNREEKFIKEKYESAMSLLETGKYDEAGEILNTILDYSDVKEIKQQIKYESYAYSCINELKNYLKNPDSYSPYEITFYNSMGKSTEDDNNEADDNQQIEEDIQDEEDTYPACVMHYGAQNGFGGNSTSYALFTYSDDKQAYTILGSCNSLDSNEYDEDDEDDAYDLLICQLVNLYREGNDTVGSIDLNRLKTVLKNDAYSTIKIIE